MTIRRLHVDNQGGLKLTKRRLLQVTGEALSAVLRDAIEDIPDDVEVTGVRYNDQANAWEFTVVSETYSDAPEASLPDPWLVTNPPAEA